MATPIKTYQQKLQTSDGFQYTGTNQQDVIDFTNGQAAMVDGQFVLKSTLQGMDTPILATNWIMKGPVNFSCYSDLTFKTLFNSTPVA